MRRDRTRAPEPMRSTLPNTDQPRIPHSEYHCNWRRRRTEGVDLGLRDLLPGTFLSRRQAIFALHSFAFLHFLRFFPGSSLLFFPLAFQHTPFHPVASLVILLSPIRKPWAPPGLCFVTFDTLGLQPPRLCGSSFSIYCLPVLSLRETLLLI